MRRERLARAGLEDWKERVWVRRRCRVVGVAGDAGMRGRDSRMRGLGRGL